MAEYPIISSVAVDTNATQLIPNEPALSYHGAIIIAHPDNANPIYVAVRSNVVADKTSPSSGIPIIAGGSLDFPISKDTGLGTITEIYAIAVSDIDYVSVEIY